MHQRPVICSDIGGMAEKVADGVDGLHFRAGDPEDLARVIAKAADSTQLWRGLVTGVKPVYPMRTHVEELLGLYERILAQEPPPEPVGEGAAAIGAAS